MKHKLFNRLALSLATSVLFLSIPKAFATNAQSQVSQTEPQPLVFDLSSNERELSQQNEPKAQTVQSKVEVADNVSDLSGGLVVTFVFIAYILVGIRYRKHRLHRAALLVQQIETLERIWNMQSHR